MKKHWYMFVFKSATAVGSTYTGYDSKNVTVAMVNANKINCEMPNSACTNIVYMGYMTKKTFLEGSTPGAEEPTQ